MMDVAWDEELQAALGPMPLTTGEKIVFKAQEMRQERTGFHAMVSLSYEGPERRLLGYDTFNVGRSEDRQRLARACYKNLGETSQTVYSEAETIRDLGHFCLAIRNVWENRITVEYLHGNMVNKGIQFWLHPFILQGGSNILFAAPGQGKSYVMMLMAQSLAHGVSHLWSVDEPANVLYVNLERSATSMAHRLHGINQALGLPSETTLPVLTGRGMGLAELQRVLRRAVKDNKTDVLFVDSISRSGAGSLVEDQTGNRVVDMLNGISPSWMAIGHSPRGDDNHLFGSVMFEAGADLLTALHSEVTPDAMGISMQIVKANDIRKEKQPRVYQLLFDEIGLIDAKRGSLEDFPALMEGQPMKDRLVALLKGGAVSSSELASLVGKSDNNVRAVLSKHKGTFIKVGEEWGLTQL
jgi:hypothetical protein